MLVLERRIINRVTVLRTCFDLCLIAAIVALLFRKPITSPLWRSSVVHFVPSKEKAVALTFDDGPDPRFTEPVLRILSKYHAKATFFMIGARMTKYPDLVHDVLAGGNAVGNHTYSHPSNLEHLNAVEIVRELDRCESVIDKMTGKPTYLFRPPRGLVDGLVYAIAEEAGYQTILWTVCADHHDAPTPESMCRRVERQVRPGAIILAHDGRYSIRWKDVQATAMIVESLTRNGYRFLTVPELLERASPAHQNGGLSQFLERLGQVWGASQGPPK